MRPHGGLNCLRVQTDGYVSGNTKSPMQFAQEAPPIKVHGAVVASFGCARPPQPASLRQECVSTASSLFAKCFCGAADDPSLGCPVEYIDLRGTSVDSPAVCKYTGKPQCLLGCGAGWPVLPHMPGGCKLPSPGSLAAAAARVGRDSSDWDCWCREQVLQRRLATWRSLSCASSAQAAQLCWG